MGIRFYCPNCDRRLHVKDFLAGKRGICPHCDESIRIPKTSELEDDPEPSPAPTSSDASAAQDSAVVTEVQREGDVPHDSDVSVVIQEGDIALMVGAETIASEPTGSGDGPRELADDGDSEPEIDPFETGGHLVWYVRPPSGGQYGPAEGSIMRNWLAEGRVTPDSLVWQEGWEEWRLARDVFTLGPPPTKVGSTAAQSPEAAAGDVLSHEPGGAGHNGMQDVEVDRSKVKMLEYRLNRSRGKTKEMVAIGALGIVCVVLLVLLGFVVTGRL